MAGINEVSVKAQSAVCDRTGAREKAVAEQLPIVMWCELTAGGQVAYFDGRPMVMPGPVGNDCHTVALTPHAPAQSALDELRREVEALRADRDRLEWVRDTFFTHKWNAVIGPGYRTTWHIVPHYRHIHLSDSSGNAAGDFRAAIDAAIDYQRNTHGSR
jgi:hypothetical protein